MGAILGFFTSKIAGPIFGVGLLLAGVALIYTRIELATETSRADKLDDQINNPSTGWVARNAQCETNVATLKVAGDRMAADINALAKQTEDGNARLKDLIGGALAQLRDVKASTGKLLSLPATAPIGSIDACRAGAKILKTGAP